MRRLVVVIAALVLAPAALADGGPSPGATLGGDGVVSPDGQLRFVSVPAGFGAVVEKIRTRDGRIDGFAPLASLYGIPTVAFDGSAGGLSRDGRTLVLAEAMGNVQLRTRSSFVLVDTRSLRSLTTISLAGDFAFDALSPDAGTLYLIQHVSRRDTTRYVVRAYDVAARRLRPGRIADASQRGWTMQGYPLSRATSADGRFVYTLYQNPGGTPFVHALDSLRGTAHCVGIPWQGGQDALWNLRLAVRDSGRTLAVHWRSGRPFLAIDTHSYRIAHPRPMSPWRWLALGGAAAALALAAGAVALRRRRRGREELEEELRDLLRLPEREVVV